MKKIVRLTESDLIRLVRRVINEQTLPSTLSTIGTVIGNTNRLNALLNPTSKPNEINGLTYKLSKIKDEDALNFFTRPSASNNNPQKSPGNFTYPEKFLKEVFGENSENFKSSLSNLKRVSKEIFSVVAILLSLNAVTGESSPITLDKAKHLFKSNENLGRRIRGLGAYPRDLDVFRTFLNGVDFLVKNKFDSDVFKYYSKLLQSKI